RRPFALATGLFGAFTGRSPEAGWASPLLLKQVNHRSLQTDRCTRLRNAMVTARSDKGPLGVLKTGLTAVGSIRGDSRPCRRNPCDVDVTGVTYGRPMRFRRLITC